MRIDFIGRIELTFGKALRKRPSVAVIGKPIDAHFAIHEKPEIGRNLILMEACRIGWQIGIAIGCSATDAFALVVVAISEEVELALTQVDIATEVCAWSAVCTNTHTPIVAHAAVVFHHYVDDSSGATTCVVLGGRIGNHLHFLDGICRNLVNGQGCRTAIDKDLGSTVTHGNISVQVDLDRRDITQHVFCRSSGIHWILLNVVDTFVELDAVITIAAVDDDLFHGGTYGEFDIAQILFRHAHSLTGVERERCAVDAIPHEVHGQSKRLTYGNIID